MPAHSNRLSNTVLTEITNEIRSLVERYRGNPEYGNLRIKADFPEISERGSISWIVAYEDKIRSTRLPGIGYDQRSGRWIKTSISGFDLIMDSPGAFQPSDFLPNKDAALEYIKAAIESIPQRRG